MDMASPPTLAEVFRRALETQRQDLHTAMPGRVTSVNVSGGSITSLDVRPLVRTEHVDEEGERVVQPIPVIPRVPIVYPGGGGFRLTVPIAVGDTVLLVFAETAIDKWFATGSDADPDVRRHHLSDAIAIPGLQSSRAPYSAPSDKMSIGDDNGLKIEFNGTTIALGSSSAEAVALGNALQAWANAINAWAVATQAALATAAIPVAPAPPASAPTMASSVVKVQP